MDKVLRALPEQAVEIVSPIGGLILVNYRRVLTRGVRT